MAKDPAFLYYDADASKDVAHMNRLERGGYLDIMHAQKKFGRLSLEIIKKILGKDFNEIWPSISLVMKNEEETYFIEWLEGSINARIAYTKSRRNNRKPKTSDTHEEDMFNTSNSESEHMVNEDENVNKDLNKEEVTGETIEPVDDEVHESAEIITEGDEEIEGVNYFFGIFNINLDGCNEELRSAWRKWVNRHHIRGEPLDKITAGQQIKYLRTIEGGSQKIIEKINLSLDNNWKGLNYEQSSTKESGSAKSTRYGRNSRPDDEKGRVSKERIDGLAEKARGGTSSEEDGKPEAR